MSSFVLTNGIVYWCVDMQGRLVPASSPSFYIQEDLRIKNTDTGKYVKADLGYLIEADFDPAYPSYYDFNIGDNRVDWNDQYNISKTITFQGINTDQPGLWMKMSKDQFIQLR